MNPNTYKNHKRLAGKSPVRELTRQKQFQFGKEDPAVSQNSLKVKCSPTGTVGKKKLSPKIMERAEDAPPSQ